MTNFDPVGLFMAVALYGALGAGFLSILPAYVAAKLGVGTYERNVLYILAVLGVAVGVAALAIDRNILVVLLMPGLAFVGAYMVTRDVRTTSYGWVAGTVLLFIVQIGLFRADILRGYSYTGQPLDPVSANFVPVLAASLAVFGAIGGKLGELVEDYLYPRITGS